MADQGFRYSAWTGNPEIQSRLEAVRRVSTALIKDPPHVHFQWRICNSEDFAFELAEAIVFCKGVSAFQAGVQKPDFGNARFNPCWRVQFEHPGINGGRSRANNRGVVFHP